MIVKKLKTLRQSIKNNNKNNNKNKNNKKGFFICLNGGGLMKERIVKFEKSKKNGKKYTAYIENRKTKKIRKLNFGAIGYQQYKDKTPLKIYATINHLDRKRRSNYFSRHSGTPIRTQAIKKEINKSNGLYNPKILSHKYLW
jgi:hypothetical protein